MSLDLLRVEIVKVAKSYVGQREKRNNAGFQDPEFEKKMRAIGFQTGHPWCAYFVELVWTEAYSIINSQALPHLKEFFSGSVMTTRNNFRSEKAQKFGYRYVTVNPEPGDLVVWQSSRNAGQGHIGIYETNAGSQFFKSIEGNTNAAGGREGEVVARKNRSSAINRGTSLILRGFIKPAIIAA